MKNILFVEQNQDGTVGGSQYCLLYLIKALDKKKYNPIVMFYENSVIIEKFKKEACTVICYNKPTGKKFKSPHPVLSLPVMIARKLYNFISVSLIPLIKFVFFISRNKIDLIHLNNSAFAGWEWLFASKLLRKKCITHERGFVRFNRLTAMRAKLFYKIICVSNVVKYLMHENGLKKNTITLYDGMDPDEFRKRINRNPRHVRNELGINPSCPLIGMVGNFQEWKGQHVVIRALEIIKKKYPDLKCMFIGDISTKNKPDIEYFRMVKQMIIDSGLDENVIITGYRRDVPDLINACDLMLHSSIAPEPFGMVVLEAMCLGKPIIASDLGGPKEIIEDGISGILTPPEDSDALAEKIKYLLENSEKRMQIGEDSAKRVQDKFSYKSFSNEINIFYNKLFDCC